MVIFKENIVNTITVLPLLFVNTTNKEVIDTELFELIEDGYKLSRKSGTKIYLTNDVTDIKIRVYPRVSLSKIKLVEYITLVEQAHLSGKQYVSVETFAGYITTLDKLSATQRRNLLYYGERIIDNRTDAIHAINDVNNYIAEVLGFDMLKTDQKICEQLDTNELMLRITNLYTAIKSMYPLLTIMISAENEYQLARYVRKA